MYARQEQIIRSMLTMTRLISRSLSPAGIRRKRVGITLMLSCVCLSAGRRLTEYIIASMSRDLCMLTRS